MGVTSSMRPIFMPERARAEGRLRAGSGGLGPVAASGPQLDVEGGDAQGLGLLGHVLGGQHGGVGRGLVTIGLHLHAAGHADDGLPSGQVGDVHEGVVEGSVDVSNAEDVLAVADLGTQGYLDLLLCLSLSLAWGHLGTIYRPLKMIEPKSEKSALFQSQTGKGRSG